MHSKRQLDENKEEFKPLNVSEIAIIGDGPVAYIQAIKLIQSGFTGTINIVGPRIGDFTRSGDLDQVVFDKVNEAIDPLKVAPSAGSHIKDIENQTYSHLLEFQRKFESQQEPKPKINFIHKKFSHFGQNKQLHLKEKDDKPSTQEIHSDMVFDCTGTDRAVIEAFNQDIKEGKVDAPHFTIDTYAESHYATVRAVLDNENAAIHLHTTEHDEAFDLEKHALAYALAIANLRKLGWKKYHLPSYTYENLLTNPVKKVHKSNIYLDIADDIKDEANILQATKIIYQIMKGQQGVKFPDFKLHKESKKHPLTKKMVSAYPVLTSSVKPFCYLGNPNYPAIFHVGDSTANLPFFTGKSVTRGIERLMSGLKAFKFMDGKIVGINLELYNKEYTKNVGDLRSYILDYYKTINLAKKILNEKVLERLISALEQAKDETDQVIVKQLLNGYILENVQKKEPLIKHACEKVNTLIKRCQNSLEEIQEEKNGFNTSNPYLRVDEKVTKIIGYLKSIIQFYDFITPQEKEASQKLALDMADRCKKLATFYFKAGKFKSAEKFYHFSLEIFTLFSDSFPSAVAEKASEERVVLFSNLIIIASKLKNYDEIIKLGEQVQKRLVPIVKPNDRINLVLEKIYFHWADAILEKAEKLSDKQSIQQYINKAAEIIPNVKGSEFSGKLANKLLLLKNKMGIQEANANKSIA